MASYLQEVHEHGGTVEGSWRGFSRSSHKDLWEYAQAADQAGTYAAIGRVDFENDHLGRLPQSGRAGHLEQVEDLARVNTSKGETLDWVPDHHM